MLATIGSIHSLPVYARDQIMETTWHYEDWNVHTAVQGAETGYWFGKQVRNPVVIRHFQYSNGSLTTRKFQSVVHTCRGWRVNEKKIVLMMERWSIRWYKSAKLRNWSPLVKDRKAWNDLVQKTKTCARLNVGIRSSANELWFQPMVIVTQILHNTFVWSAYGSRTST